MGYELEESNSTLEDNKYLAIDVIIYLLWLFYGSLTYLLDGDIFILYVGICTLFLIQSIFFIKIILPIERELGFIKGVHYCIKTGRRRLQHGRTKSNSRKNNT